MNKARYIIRLARRVRRTWGRNSVEAAKKMGFRVGEGDGPKPAAFLIRMSKRQAIILLNGCGDEMTKEVLCAHELGHALLEHTGVRNFNGYTKPEDCVEEYEANLFAVAYLIDDDQINTPLDRLPNFTLRTILEENIK